MSHHECRPWVRLTPSRPHILLFFWQSQGFARRWHQTRSLNTVIQQGNKVLTFKGGLAGNKAGTGKEKLWKYKKKKKRKNCIIHPFLSVQCGKSSLLNCQKSSKLKQDTLFHSNPSFDTRGRRETISGTRRASYLGFQYLRFRLQSSCFCQQRFNSSQQQAKSGVEDVQHPQTSDFRFK